jgi:hypothetical protein
MAQSKDALFQTDPEVIAAINKAHYDFNGAIYRWNDATKQKLLFAVASLKLDERVQLDGEIKLIKSIGVRAFRQKAGVAKELALVERIAIQFEQKGIFVERGVGRGRPVGSSKADAAQRPWLGPVLEKEVPALADTIIQEYADIVSAKLNIKIPGVFEFKVKKK